MYIYLTHSTTGIRSGYQVFIDSYPEAKALFDYDRLQLRSFLPGALVR